LKNLVAAMKKTLDDRTFDNKTKIYLYILFS
jgi:hypothetical protein